MRAAGPLDDEAFQLRVEENAVELSFHVGRDATSGSLRTLAGRRDAAFDLLLRLAVAAPRFDAGPVERIRQGLLAGLRREASDPHTIASKALTATIYPTHPYGRWPHGTVESISAITRDEIAGQHRRMFAKDNLVVSVVGAIHAADVAIMLDDVFGALPSTALLRPVEEVAPIVSRGQAVDRSRRAADRAAIRHPRRKAQRSGLHGCLYRQPHPRRRLVLLAPVPEGP